MTNLQRRALWAALGARPQASPAARLLLPPQDQIGLGRPHYQVKGEKVEVMRLIFLYTLGVPA
jgi:hypothetical protein